ncbi:phage tail protein [Yokenella regensburgei]|uniref:phage tail protein n=1 Tax=Yokenella regensburgei TaxID=158877 RepID=UPI003EDA60AF
MSTKYKTIITHAGAEKFAAATLPGGKKVNITAMAIGDGGGSLPEPNAGQTKLINEVWRHTLNKISQDNKRKNYIVAELVIPPEVGGFWSREMGLYDDTGTLVAVANMAESYKPELAEGSGRAQTVRMVIVVSDLESVELSIDGSVVMATKDYVDDLLTEHEKSRRHPDASLTEKGFTRLNSAVDSEDETTAATPKAVKKAMDNANVRLAKDSNLADLSNPAQARQSLQLGDSATKNTGTTANTVAAGDDTRIVDAMQKGQNGADIPDKDLFVRTAGAARAYSAGISIGGDSNPWTTAELIAWLESQGAFNHPYWMCKGSWAYANNKVITDTGCGDICLAGAVVEVMGTRGAMTIRITTPSTTSGGGIANAQFTYINHSDAYAPGWRRDYNTVNKPSASDVGAVSVGGGHYPTTFAFTRVETIPTEQNMSGLFNQTGDAGAIVSGAEFNWYNDKITTGITRGASDAAAGYAIALNGKSLVSIDQYGSASFNGNVVAGSSTLGLQGDERKHFSIMNADGSARAYIYKDKGGEGIVVLNPEGGGEFIFGKNGYLQAPAAFQVTNAPSGVPAGAGAFAEQLGTVAPFMQPNWAWPPSSGGIYVPLVKGVSTRAGVGYPTAVSFGYLLAGENGFASPCIHAQGDNGSAIWRFDPNDKKLYAPGAIHAGDAIIGSNGDIYGSAWGNTWLTTWFNAQFSARDSNINTRATWDWVSQSFISGMRFSAEKQVGATGIWTYHENTVLTGFDNKDGDFSAETLFWSYIQVYMNGQWVTIGR